MRIDSQTREHLTYAHTKLRSKTRRVKTHMRLRASRVTVGSQRLTAAQAFVAKYKHERKWGAKSTRTRTRCYVGSGISAAMATVRQVNACWWREVSNHHAETEAVLSGNLRTLNIKCTESCKDDKEDLLRTPDEQCTRVLRSRQNGDSVAWTIQSKDQCFTINA